MDFNQAVRFGKLVRYTMRGVVNTAILRGTIVQLDYVRLCFFAPDEFIEIWARISFQNGFSVMYFDAIDPDTAWDEWNKDGWQKWERFVVGQSAVNRMQNIILERLAW